MRVIFLDDRRLGTVMRFAGNKPAERWVAYSIHRPPGAPRYADGESQRFPRMRDAADWLVARDKQEPR